MPDLRLSWALAALAALAAPALAEDCPDATDFDIAGFMRDTVGEPVSHDDTLPGDTVLQTVCHDRFCVGHNSHTRQPDWVVERINPSIACGTNKRPKGWKEEEAVAEAGVLISRRLGTSLAVIPVGRSSSMLMTVGIPAEKVIS